MEIAKLILEYLRTLVWPTTVVILSLLFRREITRVFARLSKAVLPGGFSFDLREEVQELKQLSEKVQSAPPSEEQRATPSIPLTEANARMVKLGLTPTLSGLDISYYRARAETDPVLALAGLRIDLETPRAKPSCRIQAPTLRVALYSSRTTEGGGGDHARSGALRPQDLQGMQRGYTRPVYFQKRS